MANPEHVAILKQGVDIWNRWREDNPEVEIDLSGAQLRVKNLSHANLSHANLSRATLIATDLSGACLKKAILSEASLNSAKLFKTDLSNADLSEAGFRNTDLGEANLNGANLSRANLSEIEFSENILHAANLEGVCLRGAYFLGVDLFGANLSGADFLEATLSPNALSVKDWHNITGGSDPNEINLSAANLSSATLRGANLGGVNLSGVNLSDADLSDADLSDADLTETNFRNTNLSKANLSRAIFKETNLSGAILEGTNLSHTNLSQINLGGINLKGANLTYAVLVESNLENAILTDCSIYGISAWDVQLRDTQQLNLIITGEDQPVITVDNLEVAQFIYLLLNNQKIRQVVDTITSKVILILGRFTTERKQVLDALKDKLRNHNYSPVVFNFEERDESFIETARTLANMAHFVLVDLTDMNDVIREIATSIVPRCVVPIQPLLLGKHQYDRMLFRQLQQKYRWVLSPRQFKDIPGLLASFQDHIIQPVEEKITELKQRKSLKVFFGYASEDRDMLDRLKKHLRQAERLGLIEMWDDRDIESGSNRSEEIERQLAEAAIILLLISPDFLASNDCYDLQEKAMEANAKVIPILVRSCAWKSTPLGNLQVLPRDERPIKEHTLDDLFFEVSNEISDVVKAMI